MRLLVVGAAPDSLGAAVVTAANKECISRLEVGGDAIEVATAGISGEDYAMDVTVVSAVRETLELAMPDSILVTAGINIGAPVGEVGYRSYLRNSFDVNVIGVMTVLDEWIRMRDDGFEDHEQFVAISSNSAHIARRNSTAYCASKAALSMAIRCAAREFAGAPLVYGYEFGLLQGTPMTQGTEQRFGPSQTRMPGTPAGLIVSDVAEHVLHDMLRPWRGLNGTLQRLDASEQ